VSAPPALAALGELRQAAMFGPYRRTAPGEPRSYTTSGMADESVDLRDVATAASIYARLIDLLD
jgi:hypothetical protein